MYAPKEASVPVGALPPVLPPLPAAILTDAVAGLKVFEFTSLLRICAVTLKAPALLNVKFKVKLVLPLAVTRGFQMLLLGSKVFIAPSETLLELMLAPVGIVNCTEG